MNKNLVAIAGTVIALSLPVTAATAATVASSAGAAANTSLNAGGTSASASTNASASGSVSMHVLSAKSTYEQVVASADNATTADFSTVTKKTVVRIVRLSKLKGFSASANASLSGSANVQALDASVAANADLTAKLKVAGFTPDQVVAESSSNGAVTLFVNDKA